ncbi:MAG: hypothetical protein JXA83_02405 [Acidimicrobiales bacterium]|nr:hypothetical protein [Acidimicrobiales bacterium]
MNDAELDQLIATAATVSDAEVTAWNLSGPEASLREEIMTTTDHAPAPMPDLDRKAAVAASPDAEPEPAVAAPGPGHEPAVAAPGPGHGPAVAARPDRPGVPTRSSPDPIVIDLSWTGGRKARRPGRRRVLALAAAAVVAAAAIGAAAVATGGPGADDVADVAADRGDRTPAPPGGSGDPTGARPPATAEDVAAAEALPTIAPQVGEWGIAYVDAPTPAEGDMSFTDLSGSGGAETLAIQWGAADRHDDRVAENQSTFGAGDQLTVTGQAAVVFGHGSTASPTAPEGDAAPGDPTAATGSGDGAGRGTEGEGTHFTAHWVLGDHAIEASGRFPSREAFDLVLAGLQVVPAETWVTLLPPGTVLPSQRAATVDAMLTGVPLPAGFDPAPLRSAPGAVRDRYHVGADVTGAVACAWIDAWVVARQAGDTTAAEEAVGAMATSHDWDVLIEMESVGDWSDVVWEYADAMATDAPVSGGRPLTIAESYAAALGC